MFLTESDSVVLSHSDLVAAHRCEYGFLRELDARLGRIQARPQPNAMRDHLVELGKAHEESTDHKLQNEYSSFERVGAPTWSPESIRSAAAMTNRLVSTGVDVVAQPVFFDGELFGAAGYLIRQPDGTYSVWDAKASRNAHHKYVLQLATYARLMDVSGIPRHPAAGLFLMSGAEEIIVQDTLDEAAELQRRVRVLANERVAASEAISWGNDSLSFCNDCDHCAEGIAASNDVLRVFRVTKAQRTRLRGSGIVTVGDLAASAGPVAGIPTAKLESLRAQAALQLRPSTDSSGNPVLEYEVFDTAPIDGLPAPDSGDLFFDFEGDTMFAANDGTFMIEYLWGLVSIDGTYQHWWADDRDAERAALIEFVDLVAERRRAFPGMHVYHFHHYETTALNRLANKTHLIRQLELQQLLDEGVFVDLRPIVEKSLRTSARSLGLKALEPLYMATRDAGGVTDALASITGYSDYLAAAPPEAAAIRAKITTYNRDDCISTAGLRGWLVAHSTTEKA